MSQLGWKWIWSWGGGASRHLSCNKPSRYLGQSCGKAMTQPLGSVHRSQKIAWEYNVEVAWKRTGTEAWDVPSSLARGFMFSLICSTTSCTCCSLLELPRAESDFTILIQRSHERWGQTLDPFHGSHSCVLFHNLLLVQDILDQGLHGDRKWL